MNRSQLTATLGVACFTLLFAQCANASPIPNRTWVSNTGNDSNDGSIATPCATFAGALAITAAGGEIDVLNPGDYGPVIITKSITIDGCGSAASIGYFTAPSSFNAIDIEAGSSDIVVLRHLSINCGTSSFDLGGIRIGSGGTTDIEDCKITTSTFNAGIYMVGGQNLVVTDTQITGSQNTTAVLCQSGNVSLRNIKVDGGAEGINCGGATVDVTNSSITNGFFDGISVYSGEVDALNCTLTNDNIALTASGGIISTEGCLISHNNFAAQSNSNSRIRLSNDSIMNNTTGISLNGGIVSSAGNNKFAGNTTAGAPNAPINVQ